ncbi:hypothetical protein CC80DRAFT_580309 [Byssothecium circinans]|uniref:Uncharacterized protein n=1 Tax=Byssothecium circinans TaxID=147558 RepID=A0A6A5UHS6_9PLEO|nr:hypothetical protein CC80DRAFT_580309 [Byssothecium circinans]
MYNRSHGGPPPAPRDPRTSFDARHHVGGSGRSGPTSGGSAGYQGFGHGFGHEHPTDISHPGENRLRGIDPHPSSYEGGRPRVHPRRPSSPPPHEARDPRQFDPNRGGSVRPPPGARYWGDAPHNTQHGRIRHSRITSRGSGGYTGFYRERGQGGDQGAVYGGGYAARHPSEMGDATTPRRMQPRNDRLAEDRQRYYGRIERVISIHGVVVSCLRSSTGGNNVEVTKSHSQPALRNPAEKKKERYILILQITTSCLFDLCGKFRYVKIV